MKFKRSFSEFFIHFLFYIVPGMVFSQWQVVNWSRGIQDFKMLSPEIGYYTAGGLLCKTYDGADTWLLLGNYGVSSFDFIDSENGWAVGKGFVMNTTDGGYNWQLKNISGEIILNDIVMLNSIIGWIIGDDGQLFKTINGGLTWTFVPLGSSTNLNAIYFSDPDNGWIVGDEELIYKTSDGGNTWIKKIIDISSVFDITTVYFNSESNGWITNQWGEVFKTIDAGDTWQKINLNQFSSYFLDAYFLDAQYGWLCGSNASGDQGRLLNTTDGGATWKLNNLILADQLRQITFWDESLGWVVGGFDVRFNSIIKTTDGGITWEEKKSIRNSYLTAIVNAGNGIWFASDWNSKNIYKSLDNGITWSIISTIIYSAPEAFDFITPEIGWLVVYNNKILKTVDGGATWLAQATPNENSGFLLSCSFVDENTGWAVGSPGKVLKTSDGGANWVTQTTPLNNSGSVLRDVFFKNKNDGWIVGEYGKILRTTNGGSTWTLNTYIEDLSSVYFINSSIGWAVGDLGTIKNTNNGGITWNDQFSNVDANLNSVYFADEKHGWACGSKFPNGSIILTTSDGGINWEVSNGNSPLIQSMDGDPNGYVVLAGDNGLILKNTIPFGVGIHEIENPENELSTLKIQPNPFADEIAIESILDTVDGICSIEVKVVNIFGQLFFNEKNIQKSYHIDSSNWPSGVYILKILLSHKEVSHVLIKI